MDFCNIMEQLSPAIKKSCRISQPDESPEKIISSSSNPNTITKDLFIEDSILEKENCGEELLKTPVVGSNSTTAPRVSFRKVQNITDNSGETFSPNSRKDMQRRKLENKSKYEASTKDSPKAKASLTFSEISAKSFYGTSTTDPITKREPVKYMPIAIKTSKKRTTSVQHRQHHQRRSVSRKPILGSIRKVNHRFKTKKVKLSVPLMKQHRLLDEIEKTIDNSGLKDYFKGLQPSHFDKQLISGRTSNILKESKKIPNDPKASVQFHDAEHDDIESQRSDEEMAEEKEKEEESPDSKRKFFKSKRTATENRYQVTKGMSATVKRGHGIKLLSPPKKKSKMNDEYDELLSIRNEVIDIVKRLSSSNNAVINDVESPNTSDNGTTSIANGSLQPSNIDTSDKYRNMIPYNTTDLDEINRQQTVLEILIENGICNDENFKIFISEHEQHKDEAEQILNNLFDISVSYDMDEQVNDTLTAISPNDEIASQNQTMSTRHTHDQVRDESKLEFHPIFYKEHRRSEMKKDLLAVPLPKKLLKWVPISENQLQIDAGQKEFGSKNCSECGMFYTLHDPDDENLHQKFHNNMMGVLSFKVSRI